MRCETCREMVSSQLDGELDDAGAHQVDEHLAGCAACRAEASRLADLHRALRVDVLRAGALDVPDLTAAILADHDRGARADRRRRLATARAGRDARWALGTLGVLQVLIALPAVVRPGVEHLGHTGTHSAGWDLAFGIGLLVVALQPWRARGMLPIAAAVTAVMVGQAVADAAAGRGEPMPEISHVIEVVGLGLLWAVGRWSMPSDPARRTPDLAPSAPDSATAPVGLRLVPSRHHTPPASARSGGRRAA